MREDRLQILIVDDEEIIHLTLGEYLQYKGHTVYKALDGRSGLVEMTERDFDLVLVDQKMPDMDGLTMVSRAREIMADSSYVIITGHANMESAVQAIRCEAADFLVKPVKLSEIDGVLEKTQSLKKRRQKDLPTSNTGSLSRTTPGESGASGFVGVSAAAESVRRQIDDAVLGGCDTVLITGETGTGKEVVAGAIHRAGSNKVDPFIPVNCPAIPENLMESELFGHDRGAFTGATESRPGSFELADGGTLFMDEIGDLAPSSQAALLRALETRNFRRIGGSRDIRVALRIIAATNMDLEEAIESGIFRRDLFYRLNFFQIHIPPLRERKEDIVPLAEHFLARIGHRKNDYCVEIAEDARKLLIQHDYPGNVRELRNILERADIVCRSRGRRILDTQCLKHLKIRKSTPAYLEAAREPEEEQTILLQTLESHKWNRSRAALHLGIPYSTLRYKLMKYGIGNA